MVEERVIEVINRPLRPLGGFLFRWSQQRGWRFPPIAPHRRRACRSLGAHFPYRRFKTDLLSFLRHLHRLPDFWVTVSVLGLGIIPLGPRIFRDLGQFRHHFRGGEDHVKIPAGSDFSALHIVNQFLVTHEIGAGIFGFLHFTRGDDRDFLTRPVPWEASECRGHFHRYFVILMPGWRWTSTASSNLGHGMCLEEGNGFGERITFSASILSITPRYFFPCFIVFRGRSALSTQKAPTNKELSFNFNAHGASGPGDDLHGGFNVIGVEIAHFFLGDFADLGGGNLCRPSSFRGLAAPFSIWAAFLRRSEAGGFL